MTEQGVDARTVAEHIRWLRDEAAEATTPMQILKLVYIAHGWMLGATGHPLVRDRIEAWRYGPVIPSVYHRYKIFGEYPIMMGGLRDRSAKLGDGQATFVASVERAYRSYSGVELSSMTHQKGSPWDITVRKHGLKNAIIPNALIGQYYRRLMEERSS